MSSKRFAMTGLLVLATGAVGCDGASERVSVGGVVTLNGRPVNFATIVFEPQEEEDIKAKALVIGGRFEVVAGRRPTPGQYNVRFIESEPEFNVLAAARRRGRTVVPIATPIPPRYQEARTLTVTVPEGGKTDFVFNLSSRGVAKR